MESQARADECWMKLGEAAFALGVSEITLRRKVKGGRLPHEFRDGKYYVLVHRDPKTGACVEVGDGASGLVTSLGVGALSRAEKPSISQQAEASNTRLRELRGVLDEKENLIRTLRRTVEDQATLIGFLEQSLADLAERQEKDSLRRSIMANRKLLLDEVASRG